MKSFLQLFLPARDLAFIIVGTIILCSTGLANNFPFVYPDSGSYIIHGVTLEVPWGRPIFYSLFFKYASFRDTPFLPIFFQSLMLSYLCFLLFRAFSKNPYWRHLFLATLVLLTLTTGLSYTASRIMPDIFTPILLLGLALLLLVKKLGIVNRILIITILVISISVHNSHALIGGGLLLLYSIAYGIRKVRNLENLIPISRLLTAWGIIVGSVLLVASVHYQLGGGFKLSKGSHVFIMRQLIEYGIVEKYLKDHCDEKEYVLCGYQDKLNGNFIWDYQNSPFRTLGGWEANVEEYKTIISDALTRPKYFKMFLSNAIEYTIKQFFTFDLDDFHPEKKGSAPYGAIKQHYPHEIHTYGMAYQTRNKLFQLKTINHYQRNLVFASLFFLFAFFLSKSAWQQLDAPLRWLIVFLFLGLIANSFVCASLSAVVTRYQFRVAWILPMLAILILFQKGVFTYLKEKWKLLWSD